MRQPANKRLAQGDVIRAPKGVIPSIAGQAVRATEFPTRDQRGEPRTSALNRERPLYHRECAPSYQEVLARNSSGAGSECAFNKRQRFGLFRLSVGAKRASQKCSDGINFFFRNLPGGDGSW